MNKSMLSGVGITFLHAALNSVTGVSAAQCARDGRNITTTTATKLVTQYATGDRTQYGTGNLMLILHRASVGNSHVTALLAWSFQRFFNRGRAEHLCILWAR